MSKEIFDKFVLLAFVIILSGCVMAVPFVKDNINSLGSIEVVMHKTPKMNVETLGGLFLQASGGLLTAPVGVAINANAANKVENGVVLLDFGGLVMKHFSERVIKEIPNWPQMVIRNQPVKKNYKSEVGNQLKFRVDKWGVAGRYFYALTFVTMKSTNGKIIWQKKFPYHSSTYKRGKKLEEFLADNGKLLKEEIAYAADLTVSDFINQLR